MKRMALVALLATLGLTACIPVEKASFGTFAGQQVVVRDGREAVLSRGRVSELIVAPANRVQGDYRPAYVAIIRNTGGAPITFRYADIRVTSIDDGRPLKVWTVDQLQAEARGQAFVGALVGAAAGAAGGYYAGSTTINGHRYTYSGYNSGVGAALASSNANMAVAQGQLTIADLENNMLKDDTIMPGEAYGGRFVFNSAAYSKMDAPRHYRITIPVGPDAHTISLTTQMVAQQ